MLLVMLKSIGKYKKNMWWAREGKMKTVLSIFVLALAVVFWGAATTPNVSAQDTEAKPSTTETKIESSNTENKPTTESKAYNYVAQPGDSYSVLARKATQTYGIETKTNLSEAQIIYIETNLTQDAGSPLLNQGQKVTIKESSVKAWVEKAQKLGDNEEAAWNYYVQFVNFNTNANGQ
jgi:hypothetical protein